LLDFLALSEQISLAFCVSIVDYATEKANERCRTKAKIQQRALLEVWLNDDVEFLEPAF
jgi:hypothetical protein